MCKYNSKFVDHGHCISIRSWVANNETKIYCFSFSARLSYLSWGLFAIYVLCIQCKCITQTYKLRYSFLDIFNASPYARLLALGDIIAGV